MLKKYMLPLSILLLAACGDNGVEEEGNEEDETPVEESENDEKWNPSEDETEGPSEEEVPEQGGSWKEADSSEGENETLAEEEEVSAEDATADADSNSDSEKDMDSEQEDGMDNSIDEEEFDAVAASQNKPGFEMVKEETFTNEIGQGVWEKYQEMTEEYELKDVANPESEGSSRTEIEEMMSDMELEPDSVDLENGDSLIVYHFPDDELAHDNGEPFIMADVTYFFNNEDNLIHSSIAPGFHELKLKETTGVDELEGINTLTDLQETHDPQVFTIGEMKINEATITQTMIPVDSGDNTLGAYVYALGDDIIYSNGDLFFTVSVDFPTYAYMYYADLVEAYAQM